MQVYFVDRDSRTTWVGNTDLDFESNTFDYFARQCVRYLCKKMDAVDGIIVGQGVTVGGGVYVLIDLISRASIEEVIGDVRNPGAAH